MESKVTYVLHASVATWGEELKCTNMPRYDSKLDEFGCCVFLIGLVLLIATFWR
jgi:hypothetical protein